MSTEVERLLSDAMRLGPSDRGQLAGLLLDSLDEGCDEGATQAWDVEIQRRLAELADASAKSIAWAEVRSRMTPETR
jgi:putative addiction module component (TIGR02574 family)